MSFTEFVFYWIRLLPMIYILLRLRLIFSVRLINLLCFYTRQMLHFIFLYIEILAFEYKQWHFELYSCLYSKLKSACLKLLTIDLNTTLSQHTLRHKETLSSEQPLTTPSTELMTLSSPLAGLQLAMEKQTDIKRKVFMFKSCDTPPTMISEMWWWECGYAVLFHVPHCPVWVPAEKCAHACADAVTYLRISVEAARYKNYIATFVSTKGVLK